MTTSDWAMLDANYTNEGNGPWAEWLVQGPAAPGLLSVEVGKEMLIPLMPFHAEDFPKDQLIDLIPQHFIGKGTGIPIRFFGEPFHRFLRQVVQMLGAEAALTGQKEFPVFGAKGIEHGRLRHCKWGAGVPIGGSFPREKCRSVAQLGQQMHGERRGPVTLPHGLDQLLLLEPLQRPLEGTQRQPTLGG